MGAMDFFANCYWVVALAGAIFLTVLAIQVQLGNDYLIAHDDMKGSLTVHLFLAALVFPW